MGVTHHKAWTISHNSTVLSTHLSLTVLRCIISQVLISKIWPHLSLQSISTAHSLKLDHLIASKIHHYLGFPFHFNTTLLTAPLELRGLAFPSISHLNSSLAVSGLHQDLSHHLLSFRKMAEITLADWTCNLNKCFNPLSPPFTVQKFPHRCPILFSWSLATKTHANIDLSILPTDLSYILNGDVSLWHLLSQFHLLFPYLPSIPTRIISNFEKYGLSLLRHFGSFIFPLVLSNSPLFLPISPQFPDSKYYLTRDWPILLAWFPYLPTLLHSICHLDLSLLLPCPTRQQMAEAVIMLLATSPIPFIPIQASSRVL